MTDEYQIAGDAAQTYVNREYEHYQQVLQEHIKHAFIKGYTFGLLRAARILKEMRGK